MCPLHLKHLHYSLKSLSHFQNVNIRKTFLSPSYALNNLNAIKFASSSSLTQNSVLEFVSALNENERQMLIEALKKVKSENIQVEIQGSASTSFRWRSEFGRPSKITKVVSDESGEITKCDEAVSQPTKNELIRLAFYNSVPFIGFGFLDNTIMILGGDSIEVMVGSVITITTMTAAALGNTLSDILSIGSALYVERFATKLGVKKPELTSAQLNLNSARRAANAGRTLGVTIGCILGMFPLLFK